MRTPSENLIQLLSRLRLCTRRDLEQCEPAVRNLAQNLPDFDSVWIDALVQRNVLTAWQADVLQSSTPDRLKVGEYLLTNAIGQSTFAGWNRPNNQTITIRHLNSQTGKLSERVHSQLTKLLQRLEDIRRSAPASICLPNRVNVEDHEDAFMMSRFVAGWSADDLLVRGGRIPSAAVSEIGRQLLEAASWLEAHQLQHGEIVLRNVRLQHDGSTVLVSPFIARLFNPTLSFTAAQRLRDVETTAPELVGTGAHVDSRSELYSIGCVLWQLLTSRPVFLSADPVTRLLKGKEHDIPDVRTLVPDCPDGMARLIHSFTRRSPQLRPASCEAALREWNLQSRGGTSATRSLLKRMPDRSFQRTTRTSGYAKSWWRSSLPTSAAVLIMVSAFAAYGVSRGLVPLPLQFTRSGTNTPSLANSDGTNIAASDQPVPDTAQVDSGPEFIPLPDPAGVVSLISGTTYKARDLKFAGVIHIETTGDAAAVLLADDSWIINATQVIVSNVQVRTSRTTRTSEPLPTIQCECDVLSMRHCVVESISTSNLATSVRWQPSSGTARVVSLKDCVLNGSGYGLWLSKVPERCEFDNVLFTKTGAGIRCDVTSSADVNLNFAVSHVTQVGGTGFLDIVSETARPENLRIQLQCGESVIAPSLAIIRVAGPENWPMNRAKVEFLLPERGNPTIVPPDVHPVVAFDRSLNQLVELSDSQIVVESLLIAKPLFRGTTDSTEKTNIYSEFELLDYEGPKLSSQMPGVMFEALPNRI